MAFQSGSEGSEPVRQPIAAGTHEQRRARSGRLGSGTLACPHCDAPVALAGPIGVTTAMECPYCSHLGRVRDFLTLGEPTRPTRVTVRVVLT